LSNDELKSFLEDVKCLVIIGMGNELRGDDSVGLEVVRMLKPYSRGNLKIFEGHTMPEAFIGPTCTVNPSHLLIIDAAEIKEKPGEWRLLSVDEIDSGLLTTHMIPPTEIALQIKQRCSTKVAFIGIQPKSRNVSLSLSKECKKAAFEVVNTILLLMRISKK
jgi:hydrogenase 3 maturation protease